MQRRSQSSRPSTAGEGRGSTNGRGIRLAELLATVSLPSDLAHNVAAESALRDALLSVRLALLAGWSSPDPSDALYLALLYPVGWTAALAIHSRMGPGGDAS